MQLGFVVVRGRSMEPTYVDGDVVLVAWGASPRVGRCHVVRLPDGDDGPRPLAIKRVTRRERLAGGASLRGLEEVLERDVGPGSFRMRE